jgi:hypothetical protein
LTYCPFYNIKVSIKAVSDGPMIFLLTFYLVTGILLKDGKTGMVNDSTQNSDDQQFHQQNEQSPLA